MVKRTTLTSHFTSIPSSNYGFQSKSWVDEMQDLLDVFFRRCVGGPYDTVNRKAFLAGVIYSALATFVYLFTNVPTLFQVGSVSL